MKNEQFILVIADGSKEMDVALKYAFPDAISRICSTFCSQI